MSAAKTLRPSLSVIVPLGITQTIGYGSIYYAYTVLAGPISQDTGLSLSTVFGCFSLGRPARERTGRAEVEKWQSMCIHRRFVQRRPCIRLFIWGGRRFPVTDVNSLQVHPGTIDGTSLL